MKKAVFLKILVLLIMLFCAAVYMVTVGVKYGKSNRALLTMRSGLIKMRKGFREFFWGFKKYVTKGIQIQQKKLDIVEKKELKRLERERRRAERERELELEVIEIGPVVASEIEKPEIKKVEVTAKVAVEGDKTSGQEPEGEKDEEVL